MSDAPTPRTDAELLMDTHPRTIAGGWPSGRKATFGHSHIVAADFARQLERELAEAWEDLRQAEESRETNSKLLDRAIIERNESRDLCAKWEEEHAACLKTAEESANLAEQAMKQRDALADALRALKDLGPPSKAKDTITKALAALEGRGE